jgi:DNA-binding response OmpR family regulator
MERILLVEDDLSLITGLTFSLEKYGFSVEVARTVNAALSTFREKTFDILVLDVTLPDGNGFDLCKTVRKTSTIPILFLTAADEEVHIVMGLDIGGDDYLTKPFRLNELISRIRALIRRTKTGYATFDVLSSNGFVLELKESRVLKNGETIEFTQAEYRLFRFFMQNPDRILTREALLNNLWDDNGSFVDDNTLSVYIRRLRSKIEAEPEHPRFLLTLRGIGYKWKTQSEETR